VQDSPETTEHPFACAGCGKDYYARKKGGIWILHPLLCKHCGLDNQWYDDRYSDWSVHNFLDRVGKRVRDGNPY